SSITRWRCAAARRRHRAASTPCATAWRRKRSRPPRSSWLPRRRDDGTNHSVAPGLDELCAASADLQHLVAELHLHRFASLLARRHRPAGVVDVEDDAVRIPELALEAFVALLAEVEEKLAAGRLDRLLPFLEVVDLEAEVMHADEVLRV